MKFKTALKFEDVLAKAIALGGAVLLGTYMAGSKLTFWAYYWLFVFFGMFLVPEIYWVIVNPKNTVSDNTWRFEDVDLSHPFQFSHWTWIHWSFAVVYLLFALWLGFHLVFGILR